MKPKLNLIFVIALTLAWGLSYALGLNSLDITLHIEAKGLDKKQAATAICYSGLALPAAEPHNLSTTLKLNLSADSTAVGISFQGLKQWLEVKLDGNGEGLVDYGRGWKRRSL